MNSPKIYTSCHGSFPREGGKKKVKKLDIILLPSETFGYCSVSLSWDAVSLCAILQAFPVIVSYTEFPLKSTAPLYETPWQDTAVRALNFILM